MGFTLLAWGGPSLPALPIGGAIPVKGLPEVSEVLVIVTMIRLMLHRLARPGNKRLPIPTI